MLPFVIMGHYAHLCKRLCCEKFSCGIFHLYISLPPYYTERVLKASSI